ncbi:MAG: DNA recombination protein RmuC [Candidatus Pacebacteria bacterium]|nr:DNA recombination protein RmuC [Candidatus Paceibacterota bacterium]
MTTESIIILISSVAFIAVFSYFLFNRLIKENAKINEEERKKMLEQVDSKKELINESIKNNREVIKDLLERMHNELSVAEKERVGEYSSLKAILGEYKITTENLRESTEGLKNILSNSQLRGKYGEEIAENLLKTIGFVKGQNYEANVNRDRSSSNRPDFTIYLPDKTKVNIDVKFPLDNFIKFTEEENKERKKDYKKQFERDVVNRIKEISTRDYINPEEDTVDFVILFVPNEMIFSFIYDQMSEVWSDAMAKKVILAGPFSFTAILRMIYQSYKNFKYQENIFEVIKLVKKFEIEYDKYNEEVDSLGKKIRDVSNQFDKVSTTRDRKLTGIVEKIKSENVLPQKNED